MFNPSCMYFFLFPLSYSTLHLMWLPLLSSYIHLTPLIRIGRGFSFLRYFLRCLLVFPPLLSIHLGSSFIRPPLWPRCHHQYTSDQIENSLPNRLKGFLFRVEEAGLSGQLETWMAFRMYSVETLKQTDSSASTLAGYILASSIRSVLR